MFRPGAVLLISLIFVFKLLAGGIPSSYVCGTEINSKTDFRLSSDLKNKTTISSRVYNNPQQDFFGEIYAESVDTEDELRKASMLFLSSILITFINRYFIIAIIGAVAASSIWDLHSRKYIKLSILRI